MLLRLAYLGVTNAFALLRLLPMGDRDKDVKIPALRHQLTILERQPGNARPRFSPGDRAFLAALLHRLPAPRFVSSACWCARRRCRGGTATSSRAATPPSPTPSGPAVHEPSARSGSWCCAVLWRDEKPAEIAGYDKPGDARRIDDRGRVVAQVGPYFRSDRVRVAQRLHRRPPPCTPRVST